MFQSNDFNFDQNFLKEVFDVKTNNKYESNKSPVSNKFQPKMKMNKKSDATRATSDILEAFSRHRKVVQRKFPGPAGILPKSKEIHTIANDVSLCDKDTTVASSKSNEAEEIVCSQYKEDMFSNCNSPWMRMREDWCTEPRYLVDHYTIAWLKAKANAHALPAEKTPFLAAIVQSISDTVLVLADRTSEIQATVTPELWTQYAQSLCPGAVLVLKHTPCLATMRKLFLTVTVNTLVAIYTKRDQSTVDVINIQNITSEDIVRQIEHLDLQMPSKQSPTQTIICSTEQNPYFKQLQPFQFKLKQNDTNKTTTIEQNSCIEQLQPFQFKPKKTDTNTTITIEQNPCIEQNDTNLVTNVETEILTQVLDGVDTTSLFDDF